MNNLPRKLSSKKLSFYRTCHNFERYAEINSIEDFEYYSQYAKKNGIGIYILGNGSNTLFAKKNISLLILKNRLPEYIVPCENNSFIVSSGCKLSTILNYCKENSLDSFYYLSSVPANVGGALAMNAGSGRSENKSIYDYVESVRYIDDDGTIKSSVPDQVVKGYRETIFTGIKSKFIIDAVFKFPKTKLVGDPIRDRILWSKEYQDHSGPNCGSVFKEASPRVLHFVKGICIFNAFFSKKTYNWIINRSDSSSGIICLITFVKFLHFVLGKKVALEVIVVK